MHISAKTVERAAAFSLITGINKIFKTMFKMALIPMLRSTYFSLFDGIKTQSVNIQAKIENIYAKLRIDKELVALKYSLPEINSTTSFESIIKPTDAGKANKTKILVNLESNDLYSTILFFPNNIANLGIVTINNAAINVFTI